MYITQFFVAIKHDVAIYMHKHYIIYLFGQRYCSKEKIITNIDTTVSFSTNKLR